MEYDGTMNQEEKQMELKEMPLNESSQTEELIFVDKEKDCTNCPDEKEITVDLGLTTYAEWEKVIPMTTKYGLKPEEIQYIYNFYNRAFKEKRQPGCGKCFVNICKSLRKRWHEINK